VPSCYFIKHSDARIRCDIFSLTFNLILSETGIG
jgi:hypothetical protein